MSLLSSRLLIPAAVVVVAWGGAHLLASHGVAVVPAAWPAASPAAGATVAPAPTTASATASPSATGGDGVPILPSALQQLNGDTRDTATGLYALIQQLEDALRTRLEQLVHQLEPGR